MKIVTDVPARIEDTEVLFEEHIILQNGDTMTIEWGLVDDKITEVRVEHAFEVPEPDKRL